MRKLLPLLTIATLCASGIAMAQPAPRPRPDELVSPPRIPFTSDSADEHELGMTRGETFSVRICNVSRIAGRVYFFAALRADGREDQTVMPGSCVFLKDIKRVGTARGQTWSGYAHFYF